MRGWGGNDRWERHFDCQRFLLAGEMASGHRTASFFWVTPARPDAGDGVELPARGLTYGAKATRLLRAELVDRAPNLCASRTSEPRASRAGERVILICRAKARGLLSLSGRRGCCVMMAARGSNSMEGRDSVPARGAARRA